MARSPKKQIKAPKLKKQANSALATTPDLQKKFLGKGNHTLHNLRDLALIQIDGAKTPQALATFIENHRQALSTAFRYKPSKNTETNCFVMLQSILEENSTLQEGSFYQLFFDFIKLFLKYSICKSKSYNETQSPSGEEISNSSIAIDLAKNIFSSNFISLQINNTNLNMNSGGKTASFCYGFIYDLVSNLISFIKNNSVLLNNPVKKLPITIQSDKGRLRSYIKNIISKYRSEIDDQEELFQPSDKTLFANAETRYNIADEKNALKVLYANLQQILNLRFEPQLKIALQALEINESATTSSNPDSLAPQIIDINLLQVVNSELSPIEEAEEFLHFINASVENSGHAPIPIAQEKVGDSNQKTAAPVYVSNGISFGCSF
jgi:hypothetical protein